MADSNGTEQAPHLIEYVKYVFGFLAAAFGYLWRRQVNRVDKLDEAIQKVKDTAISPQDLTAAMDSIRHGIDGITAELRHQSDRIDRLLLEQSQRGRTRGNDD